MPGPSQAFMQLAGGFGPWAERGGAKRREVTQSRVLFRSIRSPRHSCFPLAGKADGAQSSTPARPAALRSQIWPSLAEEAVRYNGLSEEECPKLWGSSVGVEAAAPLHKRPAPSLLTAPCRVLGHLQNGTRPAPSWGPPRSKSRAMPPLATSGTSRSLAGQRGWQPPSRKGRVAAQPREGAASPPFSAEGVRVEGELNLGGGGRRKERR